MMPQTRRVPQGTPPAGQPSGPAAPLSGPARPPSGAGDGPWGVTGNRSGQWNTAPTGSRGTGPAHADQSRPRGPSAVTVTPYLAVLVLVVAGVYISWHQGSHGGGLGGVIAGVAFMLAAVVRLALPTWLSGFLASRKRATDVLVLTVFGLCLVVLGLILPG